MAVEGLWLVEFMSREQGTWGKGVTVLETGKILGGDSGYYYIGSYSVEHTTIEAEVKITQHFMGMQNIFHPLTNVTIVFNRQDIQGGLDNKILQGVLRENPALTVGVKFTKLSELP